MRVITILALILLLLPAPLNWCSAAEGPAPNGPAADQPAQQQADQPTPDEPTDEPAAEPEPVEMTPEERADAEIGRTAAEAVDEQYEFIEDSPDIPRIDAIIQLLRPVTEKPHQTYRVKVIDSNAINAFSIPGGYLYYSQGLLQAVESDDELAAITGHEMAHVCLSHARRLMGRDERYRNILGPIILAAVLSQSESIPTGEIAAIGSLIVQDAVNHYGRAAEFEADQHAILYLNASHTYSPVAMLTVLEGLARIESGFATVDMGVLQTHPVPRDRIDAVLRQLHEQAIPIERRRVTKSLVASAAALPGESGEIGELRLNDRVVFQPTAELQGTSPVARAQRSAEVFNELLLADLRLLEVGLTMDADQARIHAWGETILTITPADASYHDLTVEALAQQAMGVIRVGFQEEKVSRAY